VARHLLGSTFLHDSARHHRRAANQRKTLRSPIQRAKSRASRLTIELCAMILMPISAARESLQGRARHFFGSGDADTSLIEDSLCLSALLGPPGGDGVVVCLVSGSQPLDERIEFSGIDE